MTPRYKHNCQYCFFLGQFNNYDLYYCQYSLDVYLKSNIGEYQYLQAPVATQQARIRAHYYLIHYQYLIHFNHDDFGLPYLIEEQQNDTTQPT